MNLNHCHFATLVIFLNVWSLGHATGGDPSQTGASGSSSGSLSNTLKALIIGHEPSIIPSTSTKLTKAQRQEARRLEEVRVKDLIDGPVSRFEGKHLFENGVHKGKIDSFDALSSTPTSAKQYLVELNRKLYKGGVLPLESSFQTWVDRLEKTTVTIIDADVDVLIKDIEPKFEAWKKAELAKNGKLPGSFPDFETDTQYKVTHLTFEPVKDAKGDLLEVTVKAEQYNTRVELGTDKNGKPSHFEKMSSADISQPVNKIRETNNIASFTTVELEQNAKLTSAFWKDIGVPGSAKNILLNEQAQKFKDFKGLNDADLQTKVITPTSGSGGPSTSTGVCSSTVPGRRKRAVGGGSGCAIFLKPNGDVDTVHPTAFVDEYKKADGKGKETLADLAKNNVDKVAGLDDVTDQKKMNKLIQLEDMKSHVSSVDVVTNVQSSKKGKASQAFTTAVDSLSSKLSAAKSNVKLSASKISAKFSKLANSKAAKGFAKGVGAVSDPLGKYFLAKTVVNGIINGDTTSLAIVGARVGYEVVTESAVWAGAKFFSTASKVGKAAKFLGKVAGPIGAVADIGLSVWSLTKSVGRLSSAKNQYERNDAIADIVSDSVDIAVTATVTVLSIAFPPAAPLIIAVGAVIDLLNKLITAIFKAANEVARINAEIPLLESEKSFVFTSRFFDWFGTRQKDYLEFLMEEKAANDMAVQHNLKFLQENPSFLGIVFPSRTLAYDGGCRLTKQHCALKNAWGCTRWEDLNTVGSGCDWNRPCSSSWGICTDHWERVGDWGYDDFKCVCDKSSTTSFGHARKNSLVDFRQKQNLYWERVVPKDVEGADFKCKPGSTSYQDYKLHQQSSKWDYLCENAIALLQPSYRRKPHQTMLFDLDDGHDRVYLPLGDSTPNLFRVGNEGTKEFYGGSGKNEFLFDGTCTSSLKGTLSGGASQSDVVTILGTCKKGEYLNIDFHKGLLSSQTGNLNMNIRNIEDVNGREKEGDNVVAGCHLRKVALRGGNVRQRDLIKIPNSQCNYNLTLMIGSFSNIESEARQGDISVLLDKDWKATTINLSVHPKDSLKLNVFFLTTASHQVSLGSSSIQGQMLIVTLRKIGSSSDELKFHLNFQSISKPGDKNQAIYFTESPPNSPYSVLLLSFSSPPVFYHTLSDMGSKTGLKRVGNPSAENVFQITGHNWYSVGGEKSDEFILHSPHVTMIDGRGGDDTLRLHSSIKTRMVLNLANNLMFKSIENVYGAPGNPVEIICGCDNKLVAPLGGSESQPDLIIVPEVNCPQRDLQIVAKGHSHVVMSSQMGNDVAKDKITLIVVASERFELETRSQSLAGLFAAIQVKHKNWKTGQGSKTSDGKSTVIKIKGNGNELIKFTLKDSSEKTKDPYLTIPHIQMSKSDSDEPSGQLIIERETLNPKILYHLSTENTMKNGKNLVEGFSGIPNLFRVSSGSWRMNGGSMNDIFTISSSAQMQITSVNGGESGENTLILETDNQRSAQGETYGVNLETEQMGFLKATTKGNAKNLHHILGRTSLPDSIHASCTTKTVNGREGAGKGQEDLVFISGKGCSKQTSAQTTIFAEKFTKVTNKAETGLFTYYVPDLLTAELDLKTTPSNLHLVKFSFNPWEYIRRIAFKENESILGIKVGQGETERDQFFKMFRKSKTEEYSNPVFEFHQPGAQVTADLHVGKDGAVAATFVIHGKGLRNGENVRGLPIHVNRFLINITETNGEKVGGNIRGDPIANANQFWLFKIENPLDILDGGDCSACTNSVHLADTFEVGNKLEIYLGEEGGYLKSGGKAVVSKLVNIHELRGRSREQAADKVTVSTCDIKKLAAVEEIVIFHNDEDDCEFDLILEIGKNTLVWFEDWESSNSSSLWMNSTFHYRFATPRSFDLKGNSEVAWLGPIHNYYLSFKVDDLESIWFDLEQERIHYSIGGEEYYHSMIVGSSYDNQFYTQPTLITQDGFKIHASRDGSILLGMGAGSSFPSESIRSEVIPLLAAVAKKLEVTIILQTDSQYINVGHGNVDGDRNVLQNVGYSESHLAGGGANDTIYDIVELSKDVFIYPGFEEVDSNTQLEVNDEAAQNSTKQTLDLTDIVVPIRIQSGTKYVPKIEQKNDDLVIKMDGYEVEHPGKIWIINGAIDQVTNGLQLLLNNAIMDLVPIKSENRKRISKRSPSAPEDNIIEWEILPRPIEIPDATVFSISKQDLEDGHEIRVANTSTKVNATFNAARNGADLYLTNVMGSRSGVDEAQPEMEITTIIISDYFKDTAASEDDDEFFNGTDSANYTDILPNMVLDVTIFLPGLSVLLNESEVLALSKTDPNQEDRFDMKMEPMQVRHWKFLLYEAEEGILEGMPDIPRTFKCAECGERANWLYYLVAITCLLLLIILVLIVPSAVRVIRSRRTGEYEPVNQNYEEVVKSVEILKVTKK